MAAPMTHELLPPLGEYDQQVEAIKADVKDVTRGLSQHQFTWRERPSRWSIAQCLVHLILAGRKEALPALDRMIGQARAGGLLSSGPYRRLRFGDWLNNWLEPPPKFRLPTLPRMAPPQEQTLIAVLPAFIALQEELQGRIRAASGLDLGGVTARTPALYPLTLGQFFEYVLAHQRRHLWQARNVRSDRDFPWA